MYCPEHLVLDTKYCMIWHWQRADVRREFVSWREVLNPLRYEINIGPGPGRYWQINDEAKANRIFSNLWFRVWGHRKYKNRNN